jgi:hypothetical protein
MINRKGIPAYGILALLATSGLLMQPGRLVSQGTQQQPALKTYSNTPIGELLPAAPAQLDNCSAFGMKDFNDVVELNLLHAADQRHIAEQGKAASEARIAQQVAKIDFLNSIKANHFLEQVLKHRPDLAGLPFILNDTCRMKKENRGDYQWATKLARMSLSAPGGFWSSFDRWRTTWADCQSIEIDDRICIDALEQILATEEHSLQIGLVEWLAKCSKTKLSLERSTAALVRLAVFAQSEKLRDVALATLQKRDTRVADPLLRNALRYPWPTVAQNAAEAVVVLHRTDLAGALVEMMELPDPRAPVLRVVSGNKVPVVRELVRINHLRNCLLCHPPVSSPNQSSDGPILVGQIPIPGLPLPSSYDFSFTNSAELSVRADITYLRPDFSINLQVANAKPWPKDQRFDFVVRSRVLTPHEVSDYEAQAKGKNGIDVYRQIALNALRELTGRNDLGDLAENWRKALGL